MVSQTLRTYIRSMSKYYATLRRLSPRYYYKTFRYRTTNTRQRIKILDIQNIKESLLKPSKERKECRVNSRSKTNRRRTNKRPLRLYPSDQKLIIKRHRETVADDLFRLRRELRRGKQKDKRV